MKGILRRRTVDCEACGRQNRRGSRVDEVLRRAVGILAARDKKWYRCRLRASHHGGGGHGGGAPEGGEDALQRQQI
jgi:hypothetical protein